MYHDTIKMNINSQSTVSFDYNFFISKELKDKYSSINYGELLFKFESIGFNTKYLKFNDLSEDDIVYCNYNYQPNFEIFFSAYTKILQYKDFYISFEYGNIINGKFYNNNMNFFAGIAFSFKYNLGDFTEPIIKGKTYKKTMELYNIIDKDGNSIATEITDINKNFEQHFFERYEVKVALRKYKLSRLKLFN